MSKKKGDNTIWAGDWSSPKIDDLINYYFDRLKWTVILLRNMMYVLFPDENRLYDYENEPPYFTLIDISFDGLMRRLEREVCKEVAGHKEQLNTIIQMKLKDVEKLLLDEKFLIHYNKFKTELLPYRAYSDDISKARNLFIFKVLPLPYNSAISFYNETFETFYTVIVNSFNTGKSRINELFPAIQQNIQNSKARDKNKTKQLSSYKWESNPKKELPELYKIMEGQFIDMTTTFEEFESIFTKQPIESIRPLKWIASNRLLAYFLDQVFKGQKWQSIAGNGKLFFSVENNKILTANDLAKAKSDCTIYGLPKGYEEIDKILKAIKKPS